MHLTHEPMSSHNPTQPHANAAHSATPVCATGKTAENMLSLLVAREGNDATTELKV